MEPEFGRTHEGALDPHHLAHALETLGTEWADKEAAADLLERLDKTLVAQLTNRFRSVMPDASRKECEDVALASLDYRDHIKARVEARRVANTAKAKYDAVKVRIEAMRTAEATKREELRSYRGR